MIEYSSFHNCKSNDLGGAVHYAKKLGQCIQVGICAYDCSSSNDGQYCMMYCNPAEQNSKNYLLLSSISRSYSSSGTSAIYLRKGAQKLDRINSTNHNTISSAAFDLTYIDSKSLVIFSNSINNTVLNSNRRLAFISCASSNKKTISIHQSVIIDNNCQKTLISLDTVLLSLMNCYIFKNQAVYSFELINNANANINNTYIEKLTYFGNGTLAGQSAPEFYIILINNKCRDLLDESIRPECTHLSDVSIYSYMFQSGIIIIPVIT